MCLKRAWEEATRRLYVKHVSARQQQQRGGDTARARPVSAALERVAASASSSSSRSNSSNQSGGSGSGSTGGSSGSRSSSGGSTRKPDADVGLGAARTGTRRLASGGTALRSGMRVSNEVEQHLTKSMSKLLNFAATAKVEPACGGQGFPKQTAVRRFPSSFSTSALSSLVSMRKSLARKSPEGRDCSTHRWF